ncbi:MAG: hypothetical protein HUU10_14165 [Bacteroidetes bacterium]|nr:hypothetical protein [Bacteroidota bacterium]
METGYDYFEARTYDSQLGRFLQVDPLWEKYFEMNPFVGMNNNPNLIIDPTGTDWFYYKKEGEEEADWHFHKDEKKAMENKVGVDADGNDIKAIISGYSVVVLINGFTSEKLTPNGSITGDGARPAEITVLQEDGEKSNFDGYTMSSNMEKYGVIEDGDYIGKPQNHSTYGPSFVLNGGAGIKDYWGYNPYKPKQNGFLFGVYIHKSNSNTPFENYGGELNEGKSAISKGCILIAGRQWASFYNSVTKNRDQNSLSTLEMLISIRRN